MKLKFYRSIISLLAILSLNSCGERASTRSLAPKIDLQAPNPPASPHSDPFLFLRNDKFGYIDRTGKIVIPPKFDRAADFSEGLASISIGEKWGFIDRTGRIVIPTQFKYPASFKHGLADVEIDDRTSVKIDRTGKGIATSIPAAPRAIEATPPTSERLMD